MADLGGLLPFGFVRFWQGDCGPPLIQRSIFDLHQFQSVRRCQARGEVIPSRTVVERLEHGVYRTSPLRNCDLHDHQSPHHAVEKSVGSHIELPAVAAPGLAPLRHHHRSFGACFLDGRRSEGSEVVLAQEERRRLHQQGCIEVRPHSPCETFSQRITNVLAEKPVAAALVDVIACPTAPAPARAAIMGPAAMKGPIPGMASAPIFAAAKIISRCSIRLPTETATASPLRRPADNSPCAS